MPASSQSTAELPSVFVSERTNEIMNANENSEYWNSSLPFLQHKSINEVQTYAVILFDIKSSFENSGYKRQGKNIINRQKLGRFDR